MFDWTIGISDLVILAGVFAGMVRLLRQQALRDQKIDLLLFGTNGQPGLLADVKALKCEFYKPEGAIARLGRSLTHVRLALAGKGIEVEGEE